MATTIARISKPPVLPGAHPVSPAPARQATQAPPPKAKVQTKPIKAKTTTQAQAKPQAPAAEPATTTPATGRVVSWTITPAEQESISYLSEIYAAQLGIPASPRDVMRRAMQLGLKQLEAQAATAAGLEVR